MSLYVQVAQVSRYWTQNSPDNFVNLLSKFIKRLVLQGNSIEKLTPLFQRAAQQLNDKRPLTNNTTNNRTLYIHWVYDPKDVNNKVLHEVYNSTLQPHVNFNKMTIALSRPKNLRDMLTHPRLSLPEGISLRDTIEQCKQDLQDRDQENQNLS